MIRNILALTVILLAANTAKADLAQELVARKAIYAQKVAKELGHAEAIANLRKELLTRIGEPVLTDESLLNLGTGGVSQLDILMKLRSNEICTGAITIFPIGYDRSYQVSVSCFDHKGEEIRIISYNDRNK
jgi:hypothetical protein